MSRISKYLLGLRISHLPTLEVASVYCEIESVIAFYSSLGNGLVVEDAPVINIKRIKSGTPFPRAFTVRMYIGVSQLYLSK